MHLLMSDDIVSFLSLLLSANQIRLHYSANLMRSQVSILKGPRNLAHENNLISFGITPISITSLATTNGKWDFH
jgi:hypothetical protein